MSASRRNPPVPPVQTPLLDAKLRRLRRRIRWTEGSRRLAILATALLSLVALALLLDWLLDLPWSVRKGWLTFQALFSLGLALWAAAGFATRQRRDPESLALMVERAAPEFRGRLIASVQFSLGHGTLPNAESAALVERLTRETEAFAEPHDFQRAIDFKPWKRASGLALILIVGFLGAVLAGGHLTRTLLNRHLLGHQPIPRQTRITHIDYDPRIGIGDSATLVVQASGRLPQAGRLQLRYDSGQRAEVSLLPDTNQPGAYRAAIDSVPDSFAWRARLNDARTPNHRVTAIPRPAVVSLTLTQTYPDYMQTAPTTHAPGDFHLFPGATVALEIRASKPVASGRLGLLGREEELAATPDPASPETLRLSLTVPPDGLSGFSIALRDREGMRSRELAAYRVTLAQDSSPEIRLLHPARSEESVVAAANLRLAWTATDRFGIREFGLCYQRGESQETQRLSIPVPAEADPREVTHEFNWALDQLQPDLQPGDQLSLWVEARDVNPETPPGASHRLRLTVVTGEEKRRQLLGRVTDAIGRLEPVAAGQEQLNEKLNDVIQTP